LPGAYRHCPSGIGRSWNCRIEDDVTDNLAPPGVSHLHEAVLGLDDGWIESSPLTSFDLAGRLPLMPSADTAHDPLRSWPVIIDQEGATVLEHDGVHGAVGVVSTVRLSGFHEW
jgi:hypothetical protein